MARSREDIIRIVREEDIKFVRMQFADIFGQLRMWPSPPPRWRRRSTNQIMFDGSSVEGFVRIDESDQCLYPDRDTFTIFPWRAQFGKTARMICDVYNTDGSPFMGDPRNVLKRMTGR